MAQLRYSGTVDEIHPVTLEPRISRAFWFSLRAYHGAKVFMHVETKLIPDATPIHLQVWEDDANEGSADDFIVELPVQTKLKNGKLLVEYTIDWSEDALGEELETEGDD